MQWQWPCLLLCNDQYVPLCVYVNWNEEKKQRSVRAVINMVRAATKAALKVIIIIVDDYFSLNLQMY